MIYIFAGLLWIPVAVLLWRAAVSKQRWPVRVGAAIAAFVTFIGSLTAPRLYFADIGAFRIESVRDWTAFAMCAVGPAYLYLWSRRHRGRGSSRTISLIAAIIGFVPILAEIIIAINYSE